MRFHATIELDGKTATGVRVPDEIVAALGGGNRPRVLVTLAGYSYQTTVARIRGEFKFPVSAAVCEAAGVAAGDDVEVDIGLDSAPRRTHHPGRPGRDARAATRRETGFGAAVLHHQKRHVLTIEGAKTPETRQRRLGKAIDELRTPR
jgi:hypothetical protein